MAQTMMLMPSVSGHSVDLRTPRLRPTSSSFSRSLLYNPLPSPAASSHRSSPVFALFKSKTKAPPKKVVKEKPKVEDGVFGTSGGIGFTKENELFVGRVAMIGFAASLLGEAITGKGILAQLNLETGVPISEIEPLVLFNVLFFFIAALNPGTGKFLTDEDLED
ncbi:hypothetical protein EUGRSUZ_F03789 [Eucalyptus grandis]|uniref:Uncharacterized protein n=2 Tax=Eucalyptus grandis TaxID=71139 RepID=A0ACC3KPZ1_EUCGR|nr:hypothetical protein EUGRSUZ_F03789 [Eucalyptus grandis]